MRKERKEAIYIGTRKEMKKRNVQVTEHAH